QRAYRQRCKKVPAILGLHQYRRAIGTYAKERNMSKADVTGIPTNDVPRQGQTGPHRDSGSYSSPIRPGPKRQRYSHERQNDKRKLPADARLSPTTQRFLHQADLLAKPLGNISNMMNNTMKTVISV